MFSFFNKIHTQAAASPIAVLQPTDTQVAFNTPARPVVLKNGEKAKDNKVGAIVLLIKEQIPNVAPKIPPAIGPSTIAPIMTGICTVVAFTIGNCIIPRGVFANKITIAIINATVTVQRVSFFCLFIFHILLVIAPYRDTTLD